MGYYLHKPKSQFAGCAVMGCRKDCCVELVATLKKGGRIYIPGCEQHTMQLHNVKKSLEEGTEPKKVRISVIVGGESTLVGLTLSELFYCESGEVLKHRSQEEQEKLVKSRVIESWKWVEDFDMWMNSKGTIVPIRKLEDKEIEDAVLLIRRVNIKRVTTRISWIKDLEKIAPPIHYAYPESQLEVGTEDAYSKLDDFYEECRSRGILP